jgi:di/tricarboxylate transporter
MNDQGPFYTWGTGGNSINSFSDGVYFVIDNILNPVVILIGALALVYFMVGVFKYIKDGGEADKKEAIQMITWGIIFLFVMTAVWGLVNLVAGTFPLNKSTPTLPRFPKL